MAGEQATPAPSGMGVDSSGAPVIDPTANVLSLVAAANRRQDDLREAESRHIREMLAVQAQNALELREAETKRIDAIRQVDVEAVQRAAEVQASQQAILANQVSAAAEAMRTQVSAAATAAAEALSKSLLPIQTDIQDLRKAQYEQRGGVAQSRETRQDTRGGAAVVIAAVSAAVALLAIFAAIAIAVVSG